MQNKAPMNCTSKSFRPLNGNRREAVPGRVSESKLGIELEGVGRSSQRRKSMSFSSAFCRRMKVLYLLSGRGLCQSNARVKLRHKLRKVQVEGRSIVVFLDFSRKSPQAWQTTAYRSNLRAVAWPMSTILMLISPVAIVKVTIMLYICVGACARTEWSTKHCHSSSSIRW